MDCVLKEGATACDTWGCFTVGNLAGTTRDSGHKSEVGCHKVKGKERKIVPTGLTALLFW